MSSTDRPICEDCTILSINNMANIKESELYYYLQNKMFMKHIAFERLPKGHDVHNVLSALRFVPELHMFNYCPVCGNKIKWTKMNMDMRVRGERWLELKDLT